MKSIKKYLDFLLKYKFQIILIAVFLCEVFLRFYQMDTRDPFGYDQVDNAWAAKAIVVDHQFPTIGMPAKANSGIYVGPAYYYMLAVVYWLFNLNPIAAGFAAGLTSIFNFWVIYFICKKLFNRNLALIAVFINTFVFHEIVFDRVQVPINFIPSIALLIFYVLYRITQGDVKKIPILALLIGFDFNIHFTAIFYPIIVFLTLPFFPRTKQALKYIVLSIPLFLIWVLPSTITELQRKSDYGSFSNYLSTNFIGFHLRRVLQLLGDGIIQFDQYIIIKQLKYIALPLFFVAFLYKSISREKLVFCFLIILFFVVPWFGFATYSGEITDYYFAISRYIALFIVSYFLYRLWIIRKLPTRVITIFVLCYIMYTGLISFMPEHDGGVVNAEREVSAKIQMGKVIKYQQGVPGAYIYYYLTKVKNK